MINCSGRGDMRLPCFDPFGVRWMLKASSVRALPDATIGSFRQWCAKLDTVSLVVEVRAGYAREMIYANNSARERASKARTGQRAEHEHAVNMYVKCMVQDEG